MSAPRGMSPDDGLRDRVVAALGDRYAITREIGRGALSVVYEGRDVRLDRPVAIKVLPPDAAFRADVRARFRREAQTAARLAHPHIVPIHAVDDEAGIVSIVMAHVAGESLGQRYAREPRPPVDELLRVGAQVADALGHAHARGVVHRDVKPDNILLEAATRRALVTDFGIARAAEGDAHLTATGVAVGTPAYMAPEQAMGDRDVDGRADVYALGVVLWQGLAGALPFTASNTPAMLLKHVGEPLPSLAVRRPDLSAAVVATVERALAKRREDRWPDAHAFRDALEAARHGGAAPAPRELPAPASAGGVSDFPPYPVGGGGEAVAAWRDAVRRWRDRMRADLVAAAAPPPREPSERPARGSGLDRRQGRDRWLDAERERDLDRAETLAHRAREFRGSARSYAFVIPMLVVINALTASPPWVLFPAIFWGLGLRRRAAALRARGLSPAAAFWGAESPDHPMATGDALVSGGLPAVERAVERFRGAATLALSFGIAAVAFLAAGAVTHVGGAGAIGALSAIGAAAAGIATLARGGLLRRIGIGWREAWSGRWKAAVASGAHPLAARLLRADVRRELATDVAEGPWGEVLRTAAADREAILEVLARLGPADRDLLPDVLPTVRHLEQRIVALATSLHRLGSDVSPERLVDVERRLAAARGAPGGADGERTVQLLMRQAETLRDLVGRRATLAAQLDGATLLLGTLKLDLLRLRSAGVQAAIGDVTTVTQEARALSRDIGRALDVAEELRDLS